MYCYFRRRANESWDRYQMADCPEGPLVLQTHAAELSSAGFSFIAPDATNWDEDPRNASNGADLNQLRPTEVIAEEWANLRLRGVATPQLSTYDRVNAGGVLWTWYLAEIFNNATLVGLDLVARNPNSTRVPNSDKIYIVADEPTLDYSIVRKIQSNGGRNDIVTPIMWSAPDASGNYEANGYLKYFSPCTVMKNATTRVFSSDVFFDPDAPCAHLKTRGSSVGDVWTISTGLPMNSIPFGGLRYNGLFLKKQFYDVFADATPTDLLFAPSWNEFAANAHPMAGWDISNPLFGAIGAEQDDEDRNTIVFDDFTSERSRVIEPGKVDGGFYYELFASCMRVYRLQAALGIVSSGAGCEVAGEECCVLHGDEIFAELWSLEATGAGGGGAGDGSGGDSLLSNSAAEAAALIAAGGWREICAPGIDNAVTTNVCFNETLVWSGGADLDVLRGPLLVYANTSIGIAGTVPLVRCVTAAGSHFVHNSTASCPNDASVELVLGFGGAAKDGLFSSAVRRCRRAAAAAGGGASSWYSVANGACGAGDADEGVVCYSI